MNRNIVTAILLSIVTCGIYGLFWQVNMDKELNELAGTPEQAKGWMVVVLTLVTCGIYGWIWTYKMGEKVETIKANAGQPAGSSPIIYILLMICLPSIGYIIDLCLMQNTINSVVPAAE